MPSFMCGVYAIEQRGADRFYIGSARNVRGRWATHRTKLNKGKHHSPFLQNAWRKHGAVAFDFYVLEECAVGQLLAREQAWMDALRPAFNVCLIAGSRRGSPQRPEVRERVAAKIRARAALITHCPRGHEYDEANTHVNKKGKRICRACARERVTARYQRETQEQREHRRQTTRAYYERTHPDRAERWSELHRARISEGQRGKPKSEAQKAKLRAARLGKPWTPAQRLARERKKAA